MAIGLTEEPPVGIEAEGVFLVVGEAVVVVVVVFAAGGEP